MIDIFKGYPDCGLCTVRLDEGKLVLHWDNYIPEKYNTGTKLFFNNEDPVVEWVVKISALRIKVGK